MDEKKPFSRLNIVVDAAPRALFAPPVLLSFGALILGEGVLMLYAICGFFVHLIAFVGVCFVFFSFELRPKW